MVILSSYQHCCITFWISGFQLLMITNISCPLFPDCSPSSILLGVFSVTRYSCLLSQTFCETSFCIGSTYLIWCHTFFSNSFYHGIFCYSSLLNTFGPSILPISIAIVHSFSGKYFFEISCLKLLTITDISFFVILLLDCFNYFFWIVSIYFV